MKYKPKHNAVALKPLKKALSAGRNVRLVAKRGGACRKYSSQNKKPDATALTAMIPPMAPRASGRSGGGRGGRQAIHRRVGHRTGYFCFSKRDKYFS